MSFSRSPRPKFQNHLVLITFHNRIFVVLSFEVVWPRRPRRPQKEPSEYFQWLHFWNQWVPLIKRQCRVRYLLNFDLKIHSGQVWCYNHNKCRFKYYILVHSVIGKQLFFTKKARTESNWKTKHTFIFVLIILRAAFVMIRIWLLCW